MPAPSFKPGDRVKCVASVEQLSHECTIIRCAQALIDAPSLQVVEVDGPRPGRLSVLVELPVTPGLTDRPLDFWVRPEHVEALPATPEVSPENPPVTVTES